MTASKTMTRAARCTALACLAVGLLGCTEDLVFQCTPGEVTVEADAQDGRTLTGVQVNGCNYLYSPRYGGWSSKDAASAAWLVVNLAGYFAEDLEPWVMVVAFAFGMDDRAGGEYDVTGDLGDGFDRAGSTWMMHPGELTVPEGEAKLTLVETRGTTEQRDAVDSGVVAAYAKGGWPALQGDRGEVEIDLESTSLPGGGAMTIRGDFRISVDAAVGGGGGGGGGGVGSYLGPGAGECAFMLSQLQWDCPETPPVFAESNCVRDIDVAEGALFCWAAECYAREGNDAQASQMGQSALDSLTRADQLCDDIAFEGGAPDCNTLNLHPCP